MQGTKRQRFVNRWRKIAKQITTLCDNNCDGVPDALLEYGAQAIQKPIKTAIGEDGMHISDVAEHFGVCNRTVKNWLRDASLPPPLKKDYDTSFIPVNVFNELVKYRQEFS